MTYPFNIAQIHRAFQILGNEHHISTDQIAERLSQDPNLRANPEQLHSDIQTLTQLSSLVEGRYLGREDFQQVLIDQSRLRVQHSADYDAALERELRIGLDYPEQDPEGVTLEFNGVVRSNSQLSWVLIRPTELDTTRPPLIFVTGLHHNSSVYLSHMVELAKREHRRIISVDLPSMGGSILPENASVYASDLHAAVQTCIQGELLMGETFDLMAHSLGTIPAREIESEARGNNERNYHGRTLGRVVLVAPVPSEEDRQLGNQLTSSFTWSAIGGLLAHGAISPSRLNELFFNRHDASEQTWLNHIVEHESYSSSLWGALSAFLTAYHHPFAGRLGEDQNLRVVLPGEDHLFVLHNPDAWRNRRGVYVVEGADHSFITGQHANVQYVDVLQHALNDSLNPAQAGFSRSEASRHFQSASWLGLSGSTQGNVGVQLRLATRVGLGVTGPLGWNVEAGVQNFVGADIPNERFSWIPQANLDAGFSVLHTLPLRFFAGGYAQSEATQSIRQNNFVGDTGVTGGFQLNFENTLVLRGQYQHPLWRSQQRALPDFGEVWFNLGAAF